MLVSEETVTDKIFFRPIRSCRLFLGLRAKQAMGFFVVHILQFLTPTRPDPKLLPFRQWKSSATKVVMDVSIDKTALDKASALAEALERLDLDRGLLLRLAVAGRKRIEEQYSIGRLASEFRQLYESLA